MLIYLQTIETPADESKMSIRIVRCVAYGIRKISSH